MRHRDESDEGLRVECVRPINWMESIGMTHLRRSHGLVRSVSQCCFNSIQRLAHNANTDSTLLCVKLYCISLLSIVHFNHKPIQLYPHNKLLHFVRIAQHTRRDLFVSTALFMWMANVRMEGESSLHPLYQSLCAHKNGCQVPFHLWV